MTDLALRWTGSLEGLSQADRAQLLERDGGAVRDLGTAVAGILDAVRRRGDEALREFTARFDGVVL